MIGDREWQSQVVANSCAEAAEIVERRQSVQEFRRLNESRRTVTYGEIAAKQRCVERDRPAFRFKLDESFGVDPALGHDVIGVFNEKTNAWSFVKLPVEKV